jgi:uncharacterized protein YjiS (DUF1127 family)
MFRSGLIPVQKSISGTNSNSGNETMTLLHQAATNDRISGTSSMFSGLGTALGHLRRSIGRINARQQLMLLDDRMLKDIGLDRSHIATACFGLE